MIQTGFLILIIVMAAGIAFVADRVGKHLGKKRISLFGLRPRHTAAVGTILLGVIIAVVTLTATLVLSSGVRLWVIQGPQLVTLYKNKIAEEQNQIDKARTQNQNLSKANQDLTNSYRDTLERLKQGQAELKGEESKYSNLQGQTTNLQGHISSLNREVGSEKQQIQSLGATERQSKSKLQSVQVQEKQAEQILHAAIGQKNEAQKANLALVDHNDKLQQQQDQLKIEIKGLETQRETARGELKKSQDALSEANRQLGDVEAQLGTVTLKLQDTQQNLQSTLAQLGDAQKSEEFLRGISATAFNERLLYSRGEEIARIPVRTNLTVAAARTELTTLIRTARVDAKRKGAKDADVYYHVDNATGAHIAPQELEQQLVNQISGVKGDQVLVACSSLNAFRTENVSLEILVMPNPMVFSAGQMIAEAPIDANKGDKVIVNEISAFLKNKVRPKALAEGLIPPINSDVSIGEVTIDDMLTLLQRIRATTNRQVRLQALAEATTRASDSLRLTFRIR